MLFGDAGAWAVQFDSLEAKLARTIERVWPGCLAFLDPQLDPSASREDPITRALIFALRRNKIFPGRIVSQYELLVAGPSGVTAPSRIDFVVTIGDDEDVYLACECKRLNVTRPSGFSSEASAYVAKGLSRFSEGRYATGMPVGVMFGYVMDGQTNTALDSLATTIGAALAALGMGRGHFPIASACWTRFATHHRCPDGKRIEVRHTLLPVPC